MKPFGVMLFLLGSAVSPRPIGAQTAIGCQCKDGSENPSCDPNVCCLRMFHHRCNEGGSGVPGMGMPLPFGGGSFGNQVTYGLFNAAISGFINGMFSQQSYPDPQQEAQRQHILELERAQAAEQDAARRRKFLQERNDLLSQLMGVKFMQDLQFKALSGAQATGELRFKKLDRGIRAAENQGDGELAQRREALKNLKGRPEEKWCGDHFADVLCPVRPIYEAGKLYESRVAAYRAAKKRWDKRCGGPSAQPDYADTDDCGSEPVRPSAEAKTLTFLKLAEEGRKQPRVPGAAASPPSAPEQASGQTSAEGQKTAVAPAVSPAPQPDLRSKDTLADASDEEVQAAGQGGFDRSGTMMGEQRVVPPIPTGSQAAQNASAPPSHQDPTSPLHGLPPAAAQVAGHGADPSGAPTWIAGSDSKENAVVSKDAPGSGLKVLGDPKRFHDIFHRQNGGTCALMAAMQLLAAEGYHRTEDELYAIALEHDYFVDEHPCDWPVPKRICRLNYDPKTRRCFLASSDPDRPDDVKVTKPSADICTLSRNYGGIPYDNLIALLRYETGKDIGGSMVEGGIGQAVDSMGVRDPRLLETIQTRLLPAARQELLDALNRGKAVAIGVDAGTLYGRSRLRREHVLVVTAAALDADGAVAGYYYNDGNRDQDGAYISLQALEDAWRNDHLFRAYIQ